MPSARDLIKQSLRDLGVLAAGQEVEADDATDAFETLNQWVTDLETQRATMFTVARLEFPLTQGVSSYTIGEGAALNTPRPLWISDVGLLIDPSTGQELTLGPPMMGQEWATTPFKSQVGSWPSATYYDAGFDASGHATFYVHPVPDRSGIVLVLYVPKAMTKFADLATNYLFPPGYEKAIRKNLALELAPMFDIEPTPRLEAQAIESMANIKRANKRKRELILDPALVGLRGRYNIYNDR